MVAGPNGSGKSTFALEYLPTFAGSIEYVNPDMMAKGLSPVDISLSAMKAGRLTLMRIAELIASGDSFGFETTLSGRGHLKLLAEAKAAGYAIHLYYLWMPERMMLPSPHLQQEMIYRRNGGEQEIDPRRVPLMRKALGL